MKGLLLKDFMLLKNQKQFFLMVAMIVLLFTFTNSDSYFALMYGTLMFSMFTLSTISYDEYDNGAPFLFTMPITRREYVKEKYVFGFLTTTIAWLALGIAQLVIRQFQTPGGNLAEFGGVAVSYLAVILVMLIIFLPLQLKFGAEKGRIAFIALALLLFIGFFAFFRMIPSDSIQMQGLLLFFAELGLPMIAGLVLLLFFAFLFVSYRISDKIMANKEF